MSGLRVFGALSASVAVAGAAVIAFGMTRPANGTGSAAAGRAGDAFSMPVLRTAHPTYAALPSSTSATSRPVGSSSARSTTPARSAPAIRAVPASSRPVVTVTAGTRPPATTAHRTTTAPKRITAPARVVATGTALPLHYSTGTATRVLTVTAHSRGSTVATLQAWTKVSGGWRKYGTSATAHIGAQGMSTSPSESRSATPIGSFTLTQAFGYYADPGTALPYFRTLASDWWISQAGSLYNTHQRCSSGCRFTRGGPNEHLRYETPYYNYAVVIDYNTRNAPGGVRQGAGSAFFLHVTDGNATAGCVAIPQTKLVSLMRWLTPSAHPRILIGVG